MKTYKGGIAVDERGKTRFVNDFNFENVKRFYQITNHEKGFIRAWHGHKQSELYVYVVKGSIWLATIDMDSETIEKIIVSSDNPSIVYVPAYHYNGYMTLEEDTIVMFFSTASLEEIMEDDFRLDYNKFPLFTKQYR